jgi:hypothetical protein
VTKQLSDRTLSEDGPCLLSGSFARAFRASSRSTRTVCSFTDVVELPAAEVVLGE